MLKKLLIAFVVLMLLVIYHVKIVDRIEIYIDEHREEEWAPRWEFKVGNFYFYTSRYDRALEIYEWIQFAYKSSDYVDDATYMMGRCYEGKLEKDKAREVYNGLIAKYPKSNYAQKAKQRMDRMYMGIY
ncbi:MAG: tetratricopeptide repeat protein [bacterium]